MRLNNYSRTFLFLCSPPLSAVSLLPSLTFLHPSGFPFPVLLLHFCSHCLLLSFCPPHLIISSNLISSPSPVLIPLSLPFRQSFPFVSFSSSPHIIFPILFHFPFVHPLFHLSFSFLHILSFHFLLLFLSSSLPFSLQSFIPSLHFFLLLFLSSSYHLISTSCPSPIFPLLFIPFPSSCLHPVVLSTAIPPFHSSSPSSFLFLLLIITCSSPPTSSPYSSSSCFPLPPLPLHSLLSSPLLFLEVIVTESCVDVEAYRKLLCEGMRSEQPGGENRLSDTLRLTCTK